MTRPASSLTPASYAHGWAGTRRALLTCWRGVRQVGLVRIRTHPPRHNNQLHEITLNAKASGFPWREHALVRLRFDPRDAEEWCMRLVRSSTPQTRHTVARHALRRRRMAALRRRFRAASDDGQRGRPVRGREGMDAALGPVAHVASGEGPALVAEGALDDEDQRVADVAMAGQS